MAIIPIPNNFTFSKLASFKLQRASNQLRSKYTGQGQVVVFPYAVWMLKASLTDYDGQKAALLRSFLVKLEGVKNTFRLPVPGYYRSQTGLTGDVTVVAAKTARSKEFVVNKAAGTSDGTPPLMEGDYFTINDELKMVMAVTKIGAGATWTIEFLPETRKPIAANATLITVNPYCLMRAADDDVAEWGMLPPFRQQTQFEAIEAVNI